MIVLAIYSSCQGLFDHLNKFVLRWGFVFNTLCNLSLFYFVLHFSLSVGVSLHRKKQSGDVAALLSILYLPRKIMLVCEHIPVGKIYSSKINKIRSTYNSDIRRSLRIFFICSIFISRIFPRVSLNRDRSSLISCSRMVVSCSPFVV